MTAGPDLRRGAGAAQLRRDLTLLRRAVLLACVAAATMRKTVVANTCTSHIIVPRRVVVGGGDCLRDLEQRRREVPRHCRMCRQHARGNPTFEPRLSVALDELHWLIQFIPCGVWACRVSWSGREQSLRSVTGSICRTGASHGTGHSPTLIRTCLVHPRPVVNASSQTGGT